MDKKILCCTSILISVTKRSKSNISHCGIVINMRMYVGTLALMAP